MRGSPFSRTTLGSAPVLKDNQNGVQGPVGPQRRSSRAERIYKRGLARIGEASARGSTVTTTQSGRSRQAIPQTERYRS